MLTVASTIAAGIVSECGLKGEISIAAISSTTLKVGAGLRRLPRRDDPTLIPIGPA
jgi:hypothetical protein